MKLICKKIAMHINSNLIWLIITIASIVAQGSCSIGTNSVSNQVGNTATPLSIDNVGVVPLLTNSPTNSIIFIRNNTNNAISGITYKIDNNKNTTNNFSITSMQCTEIQANSRCALHFNIQAFEELSTQSSVILTAEYANNSFSQVISYAKVFNNIKHGVFVNSSTINYNNNGSYLTLYLYGGANKNYTLGNLVANNTNFRQIDNTLGKSLAINEVMPIEIYLGRGNNNLATNLNINSLLGSLSLNNSIMLVVAPATNGAILTSGLSPIINTNLSVTGSFPIVNSGNITATIGTITYPSGVTPTTGANTCGATLVSYASCNIYFTVQLADGNGAITVPYTGGVGGTLTQTVTWYNSQGKGALVQMTNNSGSLLFVAGESAQATITVTNLKPYTLTNITVPNVLIVSGNALVSISGDNCTGTSLAQNSSCSYIINVTDNTVETSKQVSVGILANYNNGSAQVYSRILAVSYTASSNYVLITTSESTVLAIKNNNIFAWGLNGSGTASPLGVGFSNMANIPVLATLPTGVTAWSSVSTNTDFSCAIAGTGTNAGNIYCWGLGTSGQIGNGALLTVSVPTLATLPTGVTTWSSVSTSVDFSCAIAGAGTNVGKIYCWGLGTSGQIGNNAILTVSVPTLATLPTGVTTWSSVSTSTNFSCAIAGGGTNAGKIYCWGLGTDGQIGNGALLTVSVPTLATLPTGVTTWSGVSTSTNFSCAIAATGTNAGKVYCWGLGNWGQIGIGSTASVNVPTVTTLF